MTGVGSRIGRERWTRWAVLLAVGVVAGVGATPAVAVAVAGTDPVSGVTDIPTTVTTDVVAPTVKVPPVTGTIAPPRLNLPGPLPSTSPPPAATSGSTGAPGALVTPSPAGPASPTSGPTATPPAAGGPATGQRDATTAARTARPASRTVAIRLRRAATETVRQLTFPLGLTLATLAFLVFQHRLDKGDPRVEASLESGDDDLLRFS